MSQKTPQQKEVIMLNSFKLGILIGLWFLLGFIVALQFFTPQTPRNKYCVVIHDICWISSDSAYFSLVISPAFYSLLLFTKYHRKNVSNFVSIINQYIKSTIEGASIHRWLPINDYLLNLKEDGIKGLVLIFQ